jgi:2'-5' RNA ligase
MIRLFVGVDLPDEIRRALQSLNGGVPGARWIPPENYHVTLRFIGEVDEGSAEDIDDALSTVRARAFVAELRGVGAFGKGRQLHSLWVGVAGQAALSALHDKVDRALVRVGVEPDRRKYMPHVTLARLKAAHAARVEAYTATHALFATGPFPVTHFTLYSSLRSSGGSIYRAEAEYPLDER